MPSTQVATRFRSFAVLACAAALVGGVSACKHDNSAATKPAASSTVALPAASDLMPKTETAMGQLKSVHFKIDIAGSLPGLTVKNAEGDLTSDGQAKGTASVSVAGLSVEAHFVLTTDSFYLNAGTGGYQKLPLRHGRVDLSTRRRSSTRTGAS